MKTYLGVKQIEAKPMNRLEYNNYRGWELPSNENGTDEGYLVEYLDSPNSNHDKHAGYISWSPKDVFEKAYKEVKTRTQYKEELQPHEERVVNEAGELQNNIELLNDFIENNGIYSKLDKAEQERLKQQLMAMNYYLTVLVERIECF